MVPGKLITFKQYVVGVGEGVNAPMAAQETYGTEHAVEQLINQSINQSGTHPHARQGQGLMVL